MFVAVVLIERFKGWKRAGIDVDRLSDDEVYAVFKGLF